jgi:hypothetical protein
MPRPIRLALAVLAVLYLAAPYAFKGTQSLDTRFVFMLALLLFAGLRPRELPARAIVGATCWFGALFLFRAGLLGFAWAGHASEVAAFRTVIADVPAGARVFMAAVAPAEAPDYWSRTPLARRLSDGIPTDTHLPALLLIERHAFWPLLFDDPTQQPILLTPGYQRLADRNGGMIDHRGFERAALCGYDYLLLLDAGGEPDLAGFAGAELTLVRAADPAALFRVRPCGATPPAG